VAAAAAIRMFFANVEPFRPFHFARRAFIGQKWQKRASIDHAMLTDEILTDGHRRIQGVCGCNPKLINTAKQ
jgi:uncharacterized membrane protein YbhN (UPF0104 family)